MSEHVRSVNFLAQMQSVPYLYVFAVDLPQLPPLRVCKIGQCLQKSLKAYHYASTIAVECIAGYDQHYLISFCPAPVAGHRLGDGLIKEQLEILAVQVRTAIKARDTLQLLAELAHE